MTSPAMETRFVPCAHCHGSGVEVFGITAYAHGCGFRHDDSAERPCPECSGTCVVETEVEPVGVDDLNDQIAVACATYDAYYAAKRPPETQAVEIVDTILRYGEDHRDALVKFVAMSLHTLRLRAQDEVREQSVVNINRANSRAPL